MGVGDVGRIVVVLAWLLGSASGPSRIDGQLIPLGSVELRGAIEGDEDLSAVQAIGDRLIVVSDETRGFQVLEREAPDRYRVHETRELLGPGSTELDLEALAFDGEALFLLGSHSVARRRVRDDRSYEQNRQRIETVKIEASRDHLFRLEWPGPPGGGLESGPAPSRSLRTLLANHPILRGFSAVPSKENGIDFEGMAAVDGRVFLGLRGPVLRGNYAPVLSLEWGEIEDCSEDFAGHPEACRLLFVDLGGLGTRSLHRVERGFLLVAGAVGDGEAPYVLFFWDGEDCLPADDVSSCELLPLGSIPVPDGGKAEGLAVLDESSDGWEILVVYDGVEDGEPMRFRVPRP